MPVAPKIRVIRVTVEDFFSQHAQTLQLSLVGSPVGFKRKIPEPTINRPGLALTGFYSYFAHKRVQVLGSAEMAYLRSLPKEEALQKFRALCAKVVPCIVISRNGILPKNLLEEAERRRIAVFRTPMITMKFINAATIALEMEFAPTTIMHGSMMDIMGVGTMICGDAGIGKSECVLGLIERGYSLVSDDITKFKAIEGRGLVGTSPEMTRHHMEIRGLGIIDVSAIFGVGSIRQEKQLELLVTLKDWQKVDAVDRIGLDREFIDILGIKVPHVTIPVRVGRDLARLVEVAALDRKLKSHGIDSAAEFNQKLLKTIERNRKN